MSMSTYVLSFGGNLSWIETYPKSFRPNWSFVKSIPARPSRLESKRKIGGSVVDLTTFDVDLTTSSSSTLLRRTSLFETRRILIKSFRPKIFWVCPGCWGANPGSFANILFSFHFKFYESLRPPHIPALFHDRNKSTMVLVPTVCTVQEFLNVKSHM
jgi:hypothetical protein